MTTIIQRYLGFGFDPTDAADEGEWVRYDDHAAALDAKDAQITALQRRVEELASLVDRATSLVLVEDDGPGIDDIGPWIEQATAALNPTPKGPTP